MFTYLRICFIQRKTWCRQNRQMITTLNIVVLVSRTLSRPIPPLCWCWYIWLPFSLFISNTTHINDNSLQLSLQFIEYTELKNATRWIPFGKISLVTLNYKFICFAFKKIAQYMLSIASIFRNTKWKAIKLGLLLKIESKEIGEKKIVPFATITRIRNSYLSFFPSNYYLISLSLLIQLPSVKQYISLFFSAPLLLPP